MHCDCRYGERRLQHIFAWRNTADLGEDPAMLVQHNPVGEGLCFAKVGLNVYLKVQP